MDAAFAAERSVYDAKLEALLAEGLGGKWIVIFGDQVLGIFDDPQEGHAKGIEVAGTDSPFLLKQIGSDDESHNPSFVLGLIHAGS